MIEELKVEFCEQELVLLSSRAVHWPERNVLFISDPHFGKDASFREFGVPIPVGGLDEDLARLSETIEYCGADTLWILGDFFHTRESQSEETLAALTKWRERWPGLEVNLIQGNHDRHAGPPPDELSFRLHGETVDLGPFRLAHFPPDRAERPTLAGHLHPGIQLRVGKDKLRAPCYWLRDQTIVLPAFGHLTGRFDIERQPGDRVIAVAGNVLFEAPPGRRRSLF